MLGILLDGGLFTWAACAVGLVTLGLNVTRLATAEKIISTRTVIGLAVTIGAIGVAGTAIGMTQAAGFLADAQLPAAEADALWRQAQGIAVIPTAIGALWVAVNTALLAWRR